MITCPTCHGKDGLHGLDCGFTSVRPHMTHHDDCGCRSAEYERRIAEMGAELKDSRKREWSLERAREEDSIDHAGDVRHANALTKQANAALAERDRDHEMLVRALKNLGSWEIDDLLGRYPYGARAEEGSET